MRYAQNLAEYEQGIADGIIDENVFVIVLEEKVAKFKGQTFDWSGGCGVDTSMLATKEELTNLTNEIIDDEEVVATVLTNHEDRIAGLEESIHSYTKIDLLNATKEELIKFILENEEVTAAALTNLNKQLNDLLKLDNAGL